MAGQRTMDDVRKFLVTSRSFMEPDVCKKLHFKGFV